MLQRFIADAPWPPRKKPASKAGRHAADRKAGATVDTEGAGKDGMAKTKRIRFAGFANRFIALQYQFCFKMFLSGYGCRCMG